MTADRTAREGLREALAEHLWAQSIYPNTYSLSWAEAVAEAESTPRSLVWHSVDLIRKNADALLAGPLSDFLAAEARAERMEAERDEDLIVPLAKDLAREGGWQDPDAPWTENQVIIAQGGAGSPVYQEYLDDARSLLGRETLKSVLAETARLTAEVEALRAALALLLPFVDFAAGEGLHFVPDPDDDAGSMDAADLCEAAAKALGCELGDPDYVALLSAGHEAIRALTRTDQPEGTGSPAAAQEGESAVARTETDGGRNA